MTTRLFLLACFFGAIGLVAMSGCATSTDDDPQVDPAEEDEIKTGSFSCGDTKCKIGQQYCKISMGGARPMPGHAPSISHSCKALPAACGSPATCGSCFPSSSSSSSSGAGLFPHVSATRCSSTRNNLTIREQRP